MRNTFLAWIVIGLLAGWLSGKVTRGAGFGLIADLCLGLVGGMIGGWILALLGIDHYGYIGACPLRLLGQSSC